MRAAGDLRYDTTEARVFLHARRHRISQQSGSADDAHSRLVARGLDSQHQGFVSHRVHALAVGRQPNRASHRIDVSWVIAIPAGNFVKSLVPIEVDRSYVVGRYLEHDLFAPAADASLNASSTSSRPRPLCRWSGATAIRVRSAAPAITINTT